MKKPTPKQRELLRAMKSAPVERPTGFGQGVGGWDYMVNSLHVGGYAYRGERDANGKVFATITPEGIEYLDSYVERGGRQTVRMGDIPGALNPCPFCGVHVYSYPDYTAKGERCHRECLKKVSNSL